MKAVERKKHRYWYVQWSRHHRGFVFALSAHWFMRPAMEQHRTRGWAVTLGIGFGSIHVNYRPRPADANG